MAATEPREIDWGSARITDGTLNVGLTGSASKAWKARFENVVALLGTAQSGWGDVRLVKNVIEVSDPQQGSEGDQRHFLESVVLQANSDTEPDGDTQQESEGNPEPDADEQMARTFRGFAPDSQPQ